MIIKLLIGGLLGGGLPTPTPTPGGSPAGPATPASGPSAPAVEPLDTQTRSSASRDLEFEMGARFFVRPQSRVNTAFGTRPNDDQWQVVQSARLMSAGRYGPVRVVVQLQDVRQWGDETTTLSVEPFTGAHQAYVEVGGQGGGGPRSVAGLLRMGRQEVVQWTGRLLGNSPWQPGMRAFDAARGRLEFGRFGAELGAAVLRAPRTLIDLDNPAEPNIPTNGEQIYWAETSARVHPAFEAHAGVIVLRQGPSEGAVTRDRIVATPGLYAHGVPLPGLVYDIEGYVQPGRSGLRRHWAWAGAATLGYTAPRGLRPGIRVGYEIASGSVCVNAPDDPAGCGEAVIRDFEQLYGVRHAFRGFADLFGLTNVRDLHVRGALAPAEEIELWLDYHLLGLHQAQGRWVNTGGALVGRGWDPDNRRHTMGHEIDALVGYRPWSVLHLRSGYSLFIPTGGGRALGGPQPQHFVYLWIVAEIGHRWNLGSHS